MKKLKTSFYIKKDKSKNGLAPIYVKIKLGRTTTTMSTSKYISPERWSSTNFLINAKKIPTEVSLKNYIYEIPRSLEDIYINLIKELDVEPTITEIKNEFLGKPAKKDVTFKDVGKIHNKALEKRVAKGENSERTLEKYELMLQIFESFLELKFNCKDIAIEEISEHIVFDFDEYLRYERPNNKMLGLSNNTAVKYFSNISTVMNYSLKRGIIKQNPFAIYDKKIEELETVFLNREELRKLERTVLPSEKLNSVRDIFVFSCYTSYAPVDAMSLTQENVDIDSDGTEWIRTNRQKSDVKSDIPMLPPVYTVSNN